MTLRILIDTREQAPLLFGEVPTERATLPVGDYSAAGVTDLVALERKRVGELAVCCGIDRERFIAQVDRLRAFPVRGLVIEGDLARLASGGYRSRIRPASVVGTLVALSVDLRLPIWFAGDARGAAEIVFRILRRVVEHADEIRRDLPGIAEMDPAVRGAA